MKKKKKRMYNGHMTVARGGEGSQQSYDRWGKGGGGGEGGHVGGGGGEEGRPATLGPFGPSPLGLSGPPPGPVRLAQYKARGLAASLKNK